MAENGAVKSYIKGLSLTAKSWRLSLYLWGVNILFALIVFLPFYNLMSGELSNSLSGDRMRAGFDLYWVTDFIYKYQSSLTPVLVSIMISAGIYAFINTFLSGGIVGRLYKKSEKLTFSGFFADCGKYWGRYLRLALVTVPLTVILAGGAVMIWELITTLSKETAESEFTLIMIRLGRVFIIGGIFFFISTVADYARIGMAGNDSTKAVRWFFQSFRFVMSNLIAVTGLFILNAVGYVLITICYLELSTVMPESSMFWVFLMFILQQVFIFMKTGVRVQVYGSGVVLFMKRTRSMV